MSQIKNVVVACELRLLRWNVDAPENKFFLKKQLAMKVYSFANTINLKKVTHTILKLIGLGSS